jgi:hypothetical protein
VANELLPRAQNEATLAKEDIVIACNQAKAAQEAATNSKQKMEQMRVEFEQVFVPSPSRLCSILEPKPDFWLLCKGPLHKCLHLHCHSDVLAN